MEQPQIASVTVTPLPEEAPFARLTDAARKRSVN
jgi:hypothetical protein